MGPWGPCSICVPGLIWLGYTMLGSEPIGTEFWISWSLLRLPTLFMIELVLEAWVWLLI